MKDSPSHTAQLFNSFIFVLFTISCYGQKPNTVIWSFAGEQITKNEFALKMTATLSPGWHLYSQFVEEGGPLPTRFYFETSDEFQLLGKALEKGNPVKLYDENYEMEITWYSGVATFLQKIQAHGPLITIGGRVEYMTCNNDVCIPGRQDFTLKLPMQK